ncbi:hypothetical protein M885DRAFT_547848 [Pelagophyceae sp. CCMP2097]|nr:hypothetical protein M885DRAFT_547848 [Pelagophyceae sp. CCMP2097]
MSHRLNPIWHCENCGYAKNAVRAAACVCGAAAPRTRIGARRGGALVLVSLRGARVGAAALARVYDVHADRYRDVPLEHATQDAPLDDRVRLAVDAALTRFAADDAALRKSAAAAAAAAARNEGGAARAGPRGCDSPVYGPRSAPPRARRSPPCALCEAPLALSARASLQRIRRWRDDHGVPFARESERGLVDVTASERGLVEFTAAPRNDAAAPGVCLFCAQLLEAEYEAAPPCRPSAPKLLHRMSTHFDLAYRPPSPPNARAAHDVSVTQLRETISAALAPRRQSLTLAPFRGLAPLPLPAKHARTKKTARAPATAGKLPPLASTTVRSEADDDASSSSDGQGRQEGADFEFSSKLKRLEDGPTTRRITELRQRIWKTELALAAAQPGSPAQRRALRRPSLKLRQEADEERAARARDEEATARRVSAADDERRRACAPSDALGAEAAARTRRRRKRDEDATAVETSDALGAEAAARTRRRRQRDEDATAVETTVHFPPPPPTPPTPPRKRQHSTPLRAPLRDLATLPPVRQCQASNGRPRPAKLKARADEHKARADARPAFSARDHVAAAYG